MDEKEQGFDSDVKSQFLKIAASISVGASWMALMALLGLSMKLAIVHDTGMRWYNWVFYFIFLLSFAGVVLYMYRKWKDDIR